MKIGTITFHWATNYGAVLQSYALQQYLKLNGYKTEIINYIPIRVKIFQILSDIRHLNVNSLLKEYRINQFRKQNLTLSKMIYRANIDLVKNCHGYDIYICGSDQIWNEWFVLSSESKPNLSYYLNFVKHNNTRISYATSFGTDKLSAKVINLVRPELAKFQSISVREKTGKEIIQDMGLQGTLVVDPTLLLERESYEKLIEKRMFKEEYQLFSYILHKNQRTANTINEYVFDKFFNKRLDKKYNQEPIGILEWLYNIRNAKLVVTNSFHGAVFAIIFHTHFIVVPVENSAMNNRITTLLNAVGLNDRIVDTLDTNVIDRLVANDINWCKVDDKVKALRAQSMQFLEESLGVYK